MWAAHGAADELTETHCETRKERAREMLIWCNEACVLRNYANAWFSMQAGDMFILGLHFWAQKGFQMKRYTSSWPHAHWKGVKTAFKGLIYISYHSKPVWDYFFCWTQQKLFWRILASELFLAPIDFIVCFMEVNGGQQLTQIWNNLGRENNNRILISEWIIPFNQACLSHKRTQLSSIKIVI